MALHKTRGIVLHQVKFSETSVIAKIYTETFGLQSYIVKGVRKRKPAVSSSLLQHLSLVDMEVYFKEKADIQNIKEIRSAFPFGSIPFDIVKSSIALFINEMILKSLREGDPNPELFEFLFTSIQMLDISTVRITDFHLWFCIRLTKYLGFFPQDDHSSTAIYFDLKEGHFVNRVPDHLYFLDKSDSLYFLKLSQSDFNALEDIYLSASRRKHLLLQIISYYKLHMEGFREIHSHLVLEQVME